MADETSRSDPVAAIRRHVGHSADGAGWLGAPELPGVAEILCGVQGVGGLAPNIVDGPWPSRTEYLETHYEILRREGLEGLRLSVQCYRDNANMSDTKDTCVYTNVRVGGYLMTRFGAAARVSFSTARAGRKIKWPLSRRLTPGTVVAVTTVEDGFDAICKIATVAQRPYAGGLDQNPPEIDIFWANPEDAVFDPAEKLVMVESRAGYYESVRHPLVGLQHAAAEQSPLFKYVLGWAPNDGGAVPARIRKSPLADVRAVANVPVEVAEKGRKLFETKASLGNHDILTPFPADVDQISTLDNSQLEAVRSMVSRELTIVQGPPGTGKTFTSVSALRVVLANRRPTDPPVVISAQTNQALDQLLLFCQDGGAKILRLGGRSDNESIKQRTVFNLRKSRGGRPDARFRQLDEKRRDVVRRLRTIVSHVYSGELVDLSELLDAKVITRRQFESLHRAPWDDLHDTADGGRYKGWPTGCLAAWLGAKAIVPIPTVKYEALESDEDEFDAEEDLQFEYDDDLDRVFNGDGEDRIQGELIPVGEKWTVLAQTRDRRGWQAIVAGMFDKTEDLHQIPPIMRGAVYQLLRSRLVRLLLPEMRRLLVENAECCRELKINKWTNDVQLAKDHTIDIVGCTTTGLSKYRGLLAAMEPRVLMIEEAAETREANIASAILPSLEQLILVGDHQQLTPRCDHPRLGRKPFYLNVSMFERLVNIGSEYTMLNEQRRMHPDLRKLLDPFYFGLRDHESVLTQRPAVPGMGGCNSWFFRHSWPEQTDQEHSKFNPLEAEMVIKFAVYLSQNGVDPSKITILTFYNGQRKKLMQILRRETAIAKSNELKVSTVDSYQGEENDVILLSLVRSPPTQQSRFSLGFLDDRHRVIVAMSRARRGLYIFGDVQNMLKSTYDGFETWGRIWNGFVGPHLNGNIRTNGEKGIPVVCENHGRQIWFKHPSDFIGNVGGCSALCSAKLPCGHDCQLRCHRMDHTRVACLFDCEKVLSCGHICASTCTDKCYCACEAFDKSNKTAPVAVQNSTASKVASGQDTVPNSRATQAGNGVSQHQYGRYGRGSEVRRPLQAANVAAWHIFAQNGSQNHGAQGLDGDVGPQDALTGIPNPAVITPVADLKTVSQRAVAGYGGGQRIKTRETLVHRPHPDQHGQSASASIHKKIAFTVDNPTSANTSTTVADNSTSVANNQTSGSQNQEIVAQSDDKSDWLIDFDA